MALKAVIKDLNAIEEAQRGFYVKHKDESGKESDFWVLDVEKDDRFALRDSDELMRALERERSFRRDNTPKLQTLETYVGLGSPDDIQRTLSAYEDLKKVDPENQGKKLADQQIAEWQRGEKERRSADETTINEQESTIHTLMIENAAREAIEKAGGKIGPLLPHVTGVARIVKGEDGKREVVIFDEKGDVRWKDPVVQKKFTLQDRVDELRSHDDFAGSFEGTKAAGSGTRPSGQRAPVTTGLQPKHRADFHDVAAKAKWIAENGAAAFANLPGVPRQNPFGTQPVQGAPQGAPQGQGR